jgi:5-methylcytosine-specific restriction protein A
VKRAPSVKPGRSFDRLRTAPAEPGATGWGYGRAAGWARTRERIMRRDGGLCQCHDCQTSGRTEIAHEVDHIDNRRGSGYDDDANLMAINRECHRRKSQLEARIGRGIAARPAWMDRWAR